MSTRFARYLGVVLLSALTLCGCTLPLTAPTQEVPITLLHRSHSCGTSDERANLTVVSDQKTFDGLWRRINQSLLTPPPVPTTDFEQYILVLVELGRRNNAGHDLMLSAPAATRDGGALILPVTAIVPRPDAITPQVIVAPCLLVKVQRQGINTVNALGITRQVGTTLTK